MLHCADRSFYVGHTDDLAKRVWQHEQGLVPGYTSERLPTKLVWSQEVATRDEARAAETQVKGWSRSKKLALIRGDWPRVSVLARGKDRAPTSADTPVFSAHHLLFPHLDALPTEPLNLEASVRAHARRFAFHFRLTGPVDLIAVPARAEPTRRDELWRRTCFEAFALLDRGPAYIELNFSPSGEWAAYQFDRHREGMRSLDLNAPSIRLRQERYALDVSAVADMPAAVSPTRLGLSAVLEEVSGRKSYWALAHPAPAPDFHHPDAFTLKLPPKP